ncbi:hypothetical protein P9112_004600 [Eukaryota sp. TZLM1-RC]
MSLYQTTGRFSSLPIEVRHQFLMWVNTKLLEIASSSVDLEQTANTLMRLSSGKEIEDFLLSRCGRRPEVFWFAQEFNDARAKLFSTKSFTFQRPAELKRTSIKKQKHQPPPQVAVECGCNCTLPGHSLIGNCIKCGRIACSAEGNRCFTCNSYIAGDIRHSLSTPTTLEEVKEEVSARDFLSKLLEFQEKSEERTSIVDQQSDGAFKRNKFEYEEDIILDFDTWI